jgi:hypothetical protein
MPNETPSAARPRPIQGTLGTFAGVFTPSILTILGIILFLRLGYVVGEGGLGQTLLIVALANSISVLTSLSLSAIATNLRVKRGGDYYLISRTLGHEFGGAIGIVMFLAQAISIGFYCIGFAEVLAGVLPALFPGHPHIIAAVAAGLLFVFAWLGSDWATRFQYLVMAILGAALVSFFIGGLQRWDEALLMQNWSTPASSLGFWVLFALFFPAVTGFTQGVSMSGDLKDAGRSLPLGALACLGAMLAIDLESGLVAVALLFAIYQYLRRVAPQARWADGRRSYHIQQLRSHLLAAAREAEHPRDWRPNMLLFSHDSHRRVRLLQFASWLEGDSGFATMVKVLEGRGAVLFKRKREVEEQMEADIQQVGVQVFPLAMVATDLDQGIRSLVQGFGIGYLRANIILANWLEPAPRGMDGLRELNFGRHLRTAFRLGCNLVVLDSDEIKISRARSALIAARYRQSLGRAVPSVCTGLRDDKQVSCPVHDLLETQLPPLAP